MSRPTGTDGSPQDDLELARRVLARERGAMEELMERLVCIPVIVRLKNARLGGLLDASELDDVAQESLLSVWQKLSTFDGRTRLEIWAHGFAMIELLRALDRRRRRRESALLELEPAEAPERGREPGPELDSEVLHLAAEHLSDADVEILRLKHFEELIFEDIARRLSMPTNTVKTRYYRGLERLRGVLGGRGVEQPR